MKQFICLPIFLLISISVFSQKDKHSVGLHSKGAISYLFYEKAQATEVRYFFYPTAQISYSYQKSDKVSLSTGLGLTFQVFHSDYRDEWYPETQFYDWNDCINIPLEYRYTPVKWFYIGGGINNKIPFNSYTYAQSGGGLSSAYKKRPYILEATGSTGVEFDFWKLTYRLGVFAEMPVIYRDYFNFGAETGLYFNF